jgi:outer membrane biosynthesis protein TonB
MHRFARATIAVSALSLGLVLAGCGSMDQFDPTDLFNSDIFVTKKKLPGERQPVFPEGTPGVPQGVPAELIKGNQAAAEPATTQAVPEKPVAPAKKQAAADSSDEAKPKPKPKPKVVARPAEPASQPTSVTVRRTDQQQWPDSPGEPAQQQPQAQSQPQQGGAWPGAQRGGSIWPDPPR